METTTYDYDYVTLPYPERMSPNDSLGSHLSILYYFMFLFSLFGNGLVLVIIYQFEKLTTVTNILLLNMVVSSLIFMSSLPFEALSNQLSKWIFGDVMCRIVGSVYYLGFYSSVLFLTLLTFDRHLAVVYSLKAARMFTSTPETQMETTTYDYEYGTLPYPEPMSLIDSLGSHLSILYYFMFLFSLFGNGLVLVIIYQFEKLTTVTNILLLNMVVSSLIFMSSLPFEALSNQLSKWIFGDVMCRIVGSVYYLGFYSSVLFLTLLTFDRHLAVVYSLKAAR
ncbi:C-C chemokine receptor type 8, partial [Dissostichus eleginoides]